MRLAPLVEGPEVDMVDPESSAEADLSAAEWKDSSFPLKSKMLLEDRSASRFRTECAIMKASAR